MIAVQATTKVKFGLLMPDMKKAKASIKESLKKSKTDYINLLLIHQPFGDYYGIYRAMEEAYNEGHIRAIGVSNFYPDRYLDIQHFANIKPAVNQVETHIFQQQKVPNEYMKNTILRLCHGVLLLKEKMISSIHLL